MFPLIEPTHLEFKDTHTPYSKKFGDVYFLAEQGIEESSYVYLEGVGLQDAWSKPETHLQVGEIGFGVGLNFLLTLREFDQKARPDQRLTYISVERFPVFLSDLKDLYSRFPELSRYSEPFLDQYPVLTPGYHRISFLNGRVTLILMLGDACAMYSKLEAQIQFWYWDGFAPSKNPDAFSEKLIKQISRLSTPGAKGASFTSAGWVRRALESAGFKIQKREGFHHKRECITGVMNEKPAVTAKSILPPWFSNQNLTILKPGESIAIVGAGFAGSAVARALADRGYSVTVFDPQGIANRSSGNPVGLYNIQLSKLPNPISRFSQLALCHFIRELRSLGIAHHRGIFRAAGENPQAITTALQTSEYPSDFYSEALIDSCDGYLFPECGIIKPRELCESRLNHPRVTLRKESFTTSAIKNFDHIVYAAGTDLLSPDQPLKHPSLDELPVRSIRGQMIEVKPTSESQKMKHTWVHEGYISPLCPELGQPDTHWIGATYQAKNIAPEQEMLDTQKLLGEAKLNWQSFSALDFSSVTSTRIGYRLSTPDKLPMIGPVTTRENLMKDYSNAFRGSAVENLKPLSVLPGEWMLLGLGSRGITFSSLAAEILASLMTGEPLPIEADLWEHLHSVRFSIRNLKRNGLG